MKIDEIITKEMHAFSVMGNWTKQAAFEALCNYLNFPINQALAHYDDDNDETHILLYKERKN